MNYTVSWSPFPDGTLHLNFYYTRRSGRMKRVKESSPEHAVVLHTAIVSRPFYQNLKTVGTVLTTSSDIYSGTVRITF